MARNWLGNKKITREDRYISKSTKFSDSEIRWEKCKIVIWLLLGGLYAYIILHPQTWF